MKKGLVHIAFVFSVMLMIPSSLSAQNYRTIPTYIDGSTVLQKGVYLVDRNVFVSSNGSLQIPAGTTIQFEDGTMIEVAGNIEIAGKRNDFVQFKSRNSNAPGLGIVIKGAHSSDLSIQYADFRGLDKAIQFTRNWSRGKVSIQHSNFSDLSGHGVAIEVKDVDNILTEKQVEFTFSNNTLANSSKSILIANLASENLHFTIQNNVFSRNRYIGRDLNGIFTSPLFLNYNNQDYRNPPVINSNSICYNWGSLLLPDTVDFFPVYINSIGGADELDLNNNYLGYSGQQQFKEVIDQISSNNQAPFIKIDQVNDRPGSDLNGHVYKTAVNGNRIDDPFYSLKMNEDIQTMELVANRPMTSSSGLDISYNYLFGDTLRKYAFDHKLNFQKNNLLVQLVMKDKIMKMHPNGFVTISGLQDENGFPVPAVDIGIKEFISLNRDFIMQYSNWTDIPVKVEERRAEVPEVIIDTKEETSDTIEEIVFDNEKEKDSLSIDRKSKHWEAGVFTGSTIYFGDLAHTGIQLYVPNARPNIGFRIAYRPSPRFRFELAENNMVIAGDDRKETLVGKHRGTNFDRGLSFRTTIIDLSALVEWQFTEFATLKTYVPSIFAGGTFLYFKPMGLFGGQYYDLRSVGTEGQTLNGANDTYEKVQWAIPMGVRLSKHLDQNTLITLSYTFNKSFTDYLDDVSVGHYPDEEALQQANPELGEIAVHLANPNGLSGQRSFSDNYDGYAYWGFSIYRKF